MPTYYAAFVRIKLMMTKMMRNWEKFTACNSPVLKSVNLFQTMRGLFFSFQSPPQFASLLIP